ncbi:hypothetical protein ACN09C_27650 (plasmid) [Serratia fonticola]|uniref:hypothetical protein n=1 Tax=Serratia fonticola TaxID=47917 RepID=UPI003AFF9CAA
MNAENQHQSGVPLMLQLWLSWLILGLFGMLILMLRERYPDAIELISWISYFGLGVIVTVFIWLDRRKW